MPAITTVSELTIDGKLSLGSGGSSKDLFAFYGDELREWFHAQRAMHDAIMVGAETVRCDDPELTVRHVKGSNPLRIVPSSDGRLPMDARLLNDGLPTMIVVANSAADDVVEALALKPGVEVVRCGEDRVDLDALMHALDARRIKTVMVEGGSRLLHSLFEANLVSRIIIKHIPVISGAVGAPTYLRPSQANSTLALSRWKLTDLFVKSGVGVLIYQPLHPA